MSIDVIIINGELREHRLKIGVHGNERGFQDRHSGIAVAQAACSKYDS